MIGQGERRDLAGARLEQRRGAFCEAHGGSPCALGLSPDVAARPGAGERRRRHGAVAETTPLERRDGEFVHWKAPREPVSFNQPRSLAMRIELSDDRRADFTRQLQALFRDEFDEDLSEFHANEVLDLFVKTLAPSVYNQAVQDVRANLQAKLDDLDGEIYADGAD
jgi:uncharacterized protein (DUF2164 family)